MQRSEFWKIYFWVIHASRIVLAAGSWLIQDNLFSVAALIQWLINAEAQRPSPSHLDSEQLWRPILASALPMTESVNPSHWSLTFPSVHSYFFPLLSSGIDPKKLPRMFILQTKFHLSISEFLPGTQPAGHSLISFLFQLSSWVPYFLMLSWHLLPPPLFPRTNLTVHYSAQSFPEPVTLASFFSSYHQKAPSSYLLNLTSLGSILWILTLVSWDRVRVILSGMD